VITYQNTRLSIVSYANPKTLKCARHVLFYIYTTYVLTSCAARR
jgi:hypothetical protein